MKRGPEVQLTVKNGNQEMKPADHDVFSFSMAELLDVIKMING